MLREFLDLAGQTYTDAAVGTVFSLARIGPADRPNEGFEIDVMAAAFARVDATETITAADYRVGCPLTFAMNDWQFKLGYEHTSTHTGDEVLAEWEADGMAKGVPAPDVKIVRDEIMLGAAPTLGPVAGLRPGGILIHPQPLFGRQLAIRLRRGMDAAGAGAAARFAVRGLRHGSPQRAAILPGRHREVGWRWQVGDSAIHRSSCLRLAAEYYGGKSPFGHFFEERETWWALVVAYDW